MLYTLLWLNQRNNAPLSRKNPYITTLLQVNSNLDFDERFRNLLPFKNYDLKVFFVPPNKVLKLPNEFSMITNFFVGSFNVILDQPLSYSSHKSRTFSV